MLLIKMPRYTGKKINIQGQKGLETEIEGLDYALAARLAVKLLLQAFVYYLEKFYLNADQIFYLEVQLSLCLETPQRRMNTGLLFSFLAEL